MEAAHPDAEVFSKIKENGKNLSGTLDLLIERCDQAIAALENTVLVQLKELADEERKVRRSDNGSAAAAEEGEGSRREGSVADEESADGASVADSLETPDAGEYEEGTGSVAGGTEDLNGDVEDTENGSDLAVLSRMERRESIHPHPLSGLRRDNSGYDSADLGDEDSRMLPSDDEGGSELADEGLEEEIEESMDGSEAE